MATQRRSHRSRTRIAFCIPKMIIGGVEFVFIRTLEQLLETGKYDITVILSTQLDEAYFIDWFKSHPKIKLRILFPMGNFFENLKSKTCIPPLKQIRKIAFSLYKKIKRHQFLRQSQNFDIFVDYASFGFIKELRNIHKPKITWVHGSINYFNEHKFGQRLDYYNRVVCLSNSITGDLRAQYPIHMDKFIHIYNPVDFNAIRRESKQSPTANKKYFCVVSRMDADKDIETVIHAFNEFWTSNDKPDVMLLLIGDGAKMHTLRAIAGKLDACAKIIFAGKIPRPFGYMRGAMANILSSYNEGLPTVLIEAAACESLNISSNCKSGPAEILMDGAAGILFTPGDVHQLAGIMSDVYHGRAPRDKMIAVASKNLGRFGIDEIIPQITNMIDELAKKTSK